MSSVESAIAEALRPVIRQELDAIRQELAQMRAQRADELLSVADAAKRLNVSRRTIQRMIRSGEIPSVRVGGTRRVRLAGVIP